MSKKVKYVCSHCGSDDVLFDAYAVWNVDEQTMELENTFEKGSYCNCCEGECSIDEIELENE